MFPENTHEPAVTLSGLLLQGVGRGWASRVFFSDDGSTAIEVALKMAFRKFLHDLETRNASKKTSTDVTSCSSNSDEHADVTLRDQVAVEVLGLQNSYHGDTLGAMDCGAPSVFNGPMQV
jgi:dethiobiotin synthetase/adenosylmethionine--8-amino-7-oxononanoate aminotransferase